MTSYMFPNERHTPMIFNREPALLLGALQAIIALSIGFGLDLTPEQVGLIMAAASAVVAVIVRQNVTPTSSLAP